MAVIRAGLRWWQSSGNVSKVGRAIVRADVKPPDGRTVRRTEQTGFIISPRLPTLADVSR